jgi:hypothetical protein
MRSAPWLAAVPVGLFFLNMIGVFGWMHVVSFRGFAYSPLGSYFPRQTPPIANNAKSITSYVSTLNSKADACDWFLTEQGVVIRTQWDWLQLFIRWNEISHVSKTLNWSEHWEVHHEAPDVTSPLGGSAEVMSAICRQLAAIQTGRSKDAGKQPSLPART